ncbi:MAG: hypothetical protein ACREJ3_02065, partial [Polyangiaceae bacterium]
MYRQHVTCLRRLAVLFVVLGAILCPAQASAATAVQLETRVRGIELVVHALVGGSSAPTPEKHPESRNANAGSPSGYSLAAEAFTANDVAFGLARANGKVGALVDFAGEAIPGTRAPLSEATRALPLGAGRNAAIAQDTVQFAESTLRQTGGYLRFNLSGFSISGVLGDFLEHFEQNVEPHLQPGRPLKLGICEGHGTAVIVVDDGSSRVLMVHAIGMLGERLTGTQRAR